MSCENDKVRASAGSADINVNIIAMHMGSHARHSGYDRVADYLSGHLIEGPEHFTFIQRAIARLLKPLIRWSGSLWYQRRNLLAELHAAGQWLFARGEVFHFLYGENSFRYLGLLKRINSKNAIVCTYHTPPDKFARVVSKPSHLRTVDAIVVMSTMQIPCFTEIVGAERVFFVPHGIDVERFAPKPGENRSCDTLKYLFVGSHLRDFDTLAAAARLLSERQVDVQLILVTPESNHSHFAGLENVQLMSGVSDELLLQSYQNADVFVLPLEESTANNVLLEAMACGLPIIATDLQGVRDYVNSDCAVLVPKKNAEALADAIVGVGGDVNKRNAMRVASRNRALEFRWEEVACQLHQVYETVAS